MSTQIGINENLIKYLKDKGYRPDELINKLVVETLELGGVAQMQIAPEQGQFLEIIIQQSRVPVIVDAGIGAPSHAALAMEMGADAVLVNTAIAVSGNPVEMAIAFKEAVIAGRRAFEAHLPAQKIVASASSPLTAFLTS